MKKKEEELQNQIEKGLMPDSTDGFAYQRVFEVLKKEPDFLVSLPFADRIVAIIDKKEERLDYGWMAAGIVLTLIALLVTIALTSTHWTIGVFTFLSGYPGLIVFGIAFILLLQWVDKKLIKKQLKLQ